MRGNKLEKSHIHILQSETLSRESRVAESAQEIVSSIPRIVGLFQNMSRLVYSWCRGLFYKNGRAGCGGCGGCEEEESFWKLYSMGVRYKFHALFKKVAQLHCIVRETMKLLEY